MTTVVEYSDASVGKTCVFEINIRHEYPLLTATE